MAITLKQARIVVSWDVMVDQQLSVLLGIVYSNVWSWTDARTGPMRILEY